MVFGKGRIELFLDKYQYFPGEVINGRANLKLKKPIHARGLKVSLIGYRIVRGPKGYQKSKIYNFEIPLGSEKEYTGGEYTFQIKIPETLPQPMLPPGTVGTVLTLITGTSQRIDWYVRAYLDVPMGLDVSGKVQVVIG